MPGLASRSRPVWIVDRPPGPCQYSCRSGGPGGAVTAYSNTWALGRLQPGATATFDWGVTAIKPGTHVVQYSGRGRAQRQGQGRASRRRHSAAAVHGHDLSRPQQAYVDNSGQVVDTPYAAGRPAPRSHVRRVTQAELDASQMLIPPSTAYRSISSSSSGSNSRRSSAATFCSSCSTLLAPSSAEVTRGSRSAQAIASCASVWPAAPAISFSAAHALEVLLGDHAPRRSAVPRRTRESSGTPSRYLSVSSP